MVTMHPFGPKSPKWHAVLTSAKKVVNIKKIAAYSKEGDSVLVPGKVLGIGSIPHKITLYSFSIFRVSCHADNKGWRKCKTNR